jgi:hypothetical protein
MPKAEALIDGPESRAGSFAIESEISPAQAARAFCCPLEQNARQSSAREGAAHGETMDIRGVLARDIRPEQRIHELKLDGSRGFTMALSDKELSARNICSDAFRPEFVRAPHLHATFAKPRRSFAQDGRNQLGIGGRGRAHLEDGITGL